MSTPLVAVLAFVIVAGLTVLAALALNRFWPAFQRERLAGGTATPQPGATSILRGGGEPGTGWGRPIESIGRAGGGAGGGAPAEERPSLIWAGHYAPRAGLLFVG